MARTLKADETTLYRAVITREHAADPTNTFRPQGFTDTYFLGPYTTTGAANGQIAREKRQSSWYRPNRVRITGHVQSITGEWVDVP